MSRPHIRKERTRMWGTRYPLPVAVLNYPTAFLRV